MSELTVSTLTLTEYSDEVARGIGRLMPYLDPEFSGEPTPREDLEEMITSPAYDQIIAVQHNIEIPLEERSVTNDGLHIVGAIAMTIVRGPGLGKKGQLEDVVVDPEIRRQGIGTKLMIAMKDWALAKNLRSIQWDSETHRPESWAMYYKIGAERLPDTSHFVLDLTKKV